MDIRAFEEKATTLRQRALAISRGQGADIAEAEDIAQEVMLRLWQMLDDIKDTARMERLSAVMARNMTIDMLRKRRTMPLCGNEVRFVALHDTPDESLEAAEEESWLRQRLRQLPPTQYAILGMRQVEHLSNEEIASRLGITETSVSTLLSRARRTLLDEIRRRKKHE